MKTVYDRLQNLLSAFFLTAPLMRFLAYIKNDVLGKKIEDKIEKRLIKGWRNMSILDVGSGPCRKQKDKRFSNTNITCFDIFQPYLNVCRDLGFKTVHGDARKITQYFREKSFDIVWLIDVIEHMTRRDGGRLLKDLEIIARKQIIISTPLGWYPQDYDLVDEDWGEGINSISNRRNKYQQHLSPWTLMDFEKRGYKCTVYYNCHPDIRSASRELRDKQDPVQASQIWAVKLL